MHEHYAKQPFCFSSCMELREVLRKCVIGQHRLNALQGTRRPFWQYLRSFVVRYGAVFSLSKFSQRLPLCRSHQ
jgi:hypothetical protein